MNLVLKLCFYVLLLSINMDKASQRNVFYSSGICGWDGGLRGDTGSGGRFSTDYPKRFD
jgi:hypothetical protein